MVSVLVRAPQAVGLTLTSATRAGFLVQLSAVITPMLASWAGHAVSPRIWGAATLALAGTCLIALDGTQPGADGGTGTLLAAGDLYLLAAVRHGHRAVLCVVLMSCVDCRSAAAPVGVWLDAYDAP